jgi:uncharacterized membrane protein (Fun14 family)
MSVMAFSGIVAGVSIGFLIGFIVMWAVCKRDPKKIK